MVIAIVGSGGKTTLLKKLAREGRDQGKTVFVTTTTHMFIEPDTLLTDDGETIVRTLLETGYAMAGIPIGEKIKSLSPEIYEAVCAQADLVLVEADGSKRMPLKYPNAGEPVIPGNADEIMVVAGLNSIGRKAKDICHRLELVKACLEIGDETLITAAHVAKLVSEGYLKPLGRKYPDKKITLVLRHDGSAAQAEAVSILQTLPVQVLPLLY